MRKKLFITDFDGTLLRDDKTISGRDLETLEGLRRQGTAVAIATGRSAYSLEKALKSIGLSDGEQALPVDYVIFSTGAGIMEFQNRKLLRTKSIPSADIAQIARYFDGQGMDYMVHHAIPDTRHFLYKQHREENPDFQSRMALYADYAVPLKNGFPGHFSATEVLAIVPPGEVDHSRIKQIQKALDGFSVIRATSPLDHSSTWIEVFHKGVSKSLAAKWLAEKLGVAPAGVIAVGNDYNDLDVLSFAGQGFVTENAPDDLKTDFPVVPSNNNSGITSAAVESSLL